MDWILRNIALLVVLFVAFQIVRAVLQAKKAQEQERGQQDETEQQRRIREVQEQIRRKIAERRGELPPPPVPTPRPMPTLPPVVLKEAPTVPKEPAPLDPYGSGGRVRRVMEEIERRLQPPPAPPVLGHSHAELERQARLEDELVAAEEVRHVARRRAGHAADARVAAERTETALLTSSRARLLADLGDPQSLRRAFVLREVLGPPVGLR